MNKQYNIILILSNHGEFDIFMQDHCLRGILLCCIVLLFSVVALTTKQYKLKYCVPIYKKNYNQKLEPFSYVLTNLSLLKAASLGKIASKVWRMCEDLEIR